MEISSVLLSVHKYYFLKYKANINLGLSAAFLHLKAPTFRDLAGVWITGRK
jgi:hypothetical protein